MNITILTLFPDMIRSALNHSIIKRALSAGILKITLVNIRDFTTDSYKSVDDHPYGGGVGMIMRVDVIDRALQNQRGKKILLDPQGKQFTQSTARKLSKLETIILICGHYEGVDERVRSIVDEQISIGDYVLTGGEIPALVVVDSVARLIPGVLSKEEATIHESFSPKLLEYPQYTRPDEYKGMSVPDILKGGNHAQIAKWRIEQAKKKTLSRRPDLG
ncbi:MAG: hypothetical protein ACD_36C00174G0007 [uncultured bacterium]|uniref:tRNA (guanine-N(1)-)-methyltransferase n=1 Tax=Candidatus Gottesmanbacteria bacterium RIFCSPLOWO2_01_FULL_43_11b TaxID=1798392 RepID=A0A1F6AG76_9BACT|nr:MAG: hypothetical protein ACD_36C00174G0007 [uncultured bacterium]OGG23675.1 MAG: tRNA (guanosine(37)-N1)-methyltransferase TrmD [Candidatus Gottesmanbacteria bacterium RIFCSPLOWO2_01_FULL_43_11b]